MCVCVLFISKLSRHFVKFLWLCDSAVRYVRPLTHTNVLAVARSGVLRRRLGDKSHAGWFSELLLDLCRFPERWQAFPSTCSSA